jgi:hypothetical protein
VQSLSSHLRHFSSAKERPILEYKGVASLGDAAGAHGQQLVFGTTVECSQDLPHIRSKFTSHDPTLEKDRHRLHPITVRIVEGVLSAWPDLYISIGSPFEAISVRWPR